MTSRAFALCAAAVLAACAAAPEAGTLALDGTPLAPLTVAGGDVHVLVFTSHECPIANAYAPTLRELAAHWSGRPVRLFVLHVDPELTPAAAREHARAYELPGTIGFDATHALARRLGVTRTPEAAVCTARGCVYRGRIDDQWAALGSRSAAATQNDLRDAVDAVLAGRTPPAATTEVVGCALPEPRPR